MTLPRDLELSFPFRLLAARRGADAARLLLWRLWFDLAHQSAWHGRSGVFQAGEMPLFLAAVKGDGDPATVLSDLVETGWLRPALENYYCPIFADANPQLEAHTIPESEKWLSRWEKLEEELKSAMPKLLADLPTPAWYWPDQSLIPESVMKRALVILHSLDVILYRKARPVADLGVGVIHAACALASREDPRKLSLLLRRLMAMHRPSLNPLLPHTTEETLERFGDVVFIATPDEGLRVWREQLENPRPVQPNPADAIRLEIIEHINRIHSLQRELDGGGLAVPAPGPAAD